jgi:hypothetical protein
MAVNAHRIIFLHLGPDRPAARMLSVSDVGAELATVGGYAIVRLHSRALYREHLNCDLRWDFVVGETGDSRQENYARRLIALSNREGDLTRSALPIVRFIARSILAHKRDLPSFMAQILPKGYQAFVSKKSVADAIATLVGEDGWFKSFEAVHQVRPPDEDEIFLRFEPRTWILTNRRIYLIDDDHVHEAHALEEIHTYRINTLLRRRLEIRLKSGRVVTRPVDARQYLSAADFDRVLASLHEDGALSARVKRQAR